MDSFSSEQMHKNNSKKSDSGKKAKDQSLMLRYIKTQVSIIRKMELNRVTVPRSVHFHQYRRQKFGMLLSSVCSKLVLELVLMRSAATKSKFYVGFSTIPKKFYPKLPTLPPNLDFLCDPVF